MSDINSKNTRKSRPASGMVINTAMLGKFKELDTSKYTVKEKPKRIKRSIFDAGLNL